jgi:hypothetical protein
VGHAFASAVGQAWPPFVLVVGLLLIGAVVEADGLFVALGTRIAYRGARSVRERRDDPSHDVAFEPLPETAEIRPGRLVPGWLTLDAPIIVGVAVAACLWSRWGVVVAGGLVGLGVYAILDWLHLRRGETEHGGAVYYERVPLISGGVSASYVGLHRTEQSD